MEVEEGVSATRRRPVAWWVAGEEGEAGVGGGGGCRRGGREVQGEYGEKVVLTPRAQAEGKGAVGHGWCDGDERGGKCDQVVGSGRGIAVDERRGEG